MEQLTRKQAIAFAKSGAWSTWEPDQIVGFQLFQKYVCMPFPVFHEAIKTILGRLVYSVEFACPDLLRAEYLKARPQPTLEQILDLIPKNMHTIILSS